MTKHKYRQTIYLENSFGFREFKRIFSLRTELKLVYDRMGEKVRNVVDMWNIQDNNKTCVFAWLPGKINVTIILSILLWIIAATINSNIRAELKYNCWFTTHTTCSTSYEICCYETIRYVLFTIQLLSYFHPTHTTPKFWTTYITFE